MNKFKKIAEKLFYLPKGKNRLWGSYVRSIFVLNPIITFALCFFFGTAGNYFQHCSYSLLIGTMVTTFCFGAVILVWKGEAHLARVLRRPVPNHSGGWYFSLSMVAMPVGLLFASAVMNKYGPLIGWKEHINSTDFKAALVTAGLLAGVMFLLRARRDLKDSAEKAEKERMQAQISALTAQMNPHLLFNALNTVASLVESDPKKAEGMIVKLSDLYRGVLEASKRGQHSLGEELALCRVYLEVEQARFGDRLGAEFIIDPQLNLAEIQIPTLSVQPLVENAVKHGISPRAVGGKIHLRAHLVNDSEKEKVRISVEDDGVGFGVIHSDSQQRHPTGTGTGLHNCRERLKLQYGDLGLLEVSGGEGRGTKVTVLFPRN